MSIKNNLILFLVGLTDNLIPLILTTILITMACLSALSLWHGTGSYGGKWGQYCKEDNTCNAGLVCVCDNHGYSRTNRRSICLDPQTMKINPSK